MIVFVIPHYLDSESVKVKVNKGTSADGAVRKLYKVKSWKLPRGWRPKIYGQGLVGRGVVLEEFDIVRVVVGS